MGVSPLADMSRDMDNAGRFSERNSPVTGFGIHHNAGYNAYGQGTASGREVSANYWITDEGIIIPQIDEDYRAWTSGHPNFPAGAAADHRNVTVEVSNTKRGADNGTWEISPAAYEALAALIGDVYRRHNLGPVRRGADRGVGIHRDWVSTECPGDPMVANLGNVINRAEWHRTHPKGSKPSSGGNSPAKPNTPTPAQTHQEENVDYVWIQGKANVRRGGLYAIVNGKAVFLPNTVAPANTLKVSDDAAIKALQSVISGLK